ncbi:hypothetical protein ACH427_04100 [Streptomyces sp. NPDC020379]|uniref:hypothetical protein n=1 Tax=Streptomyces sp. NPDC020379 TaxID=3365071 RepID=UPI003790803C
MPDTSAYTAGLLSQTQFGKVPGEVSNILTGQPQPMQRTSPMGNIIGGALTPTPPAPQSTITRPTTPQPSAPPASTTTRPGNYTGSNPVTNRQATTGSRP